MQVSKPVVFNQSGNTALVTNTPNIPTPAPLQSVRRSSRIVTNNNYNVKENNKSPKFASPKSPSRKTKSIRVSKNNKTTFNELNEKNKLGLETDNTLSMQNACQQVLALQKQSMGIYFFYLFIFCFLYQVEKCIYTHSSLLFIDSPI